MTPVCVSSSSYREARLASTINSRWTPDYCDWKFAGSPAVYPECYSEGSLQRRVWDLYSGFIEEVVCDQMVNCGIENQRIGE